MIGSVSGVYGSRPAQTRSTGALRSPGKSSATARAVAEDFPGLRDAPVDRVWAGLLPYTPDTLPIIDEAAPGLYLASGHVFGNAAGPMTGVLLSQLIRGQEPELDLGEVRLDRGLDLPDGTVARW